MLSVLAVKEGSGVDFERSFGVGGIRGEFCKRVLESRRVFCLKSIFEKSGNDPSYIFDEVYRLIYNYVLLSVGYKRSIGHLSVEERSCSKECIFKLQESLRNRSYRPKPIKMISEGGFGEGSRLIRIPSFEDMVIQEVFCIVLGAIWGPKFHPCSFGVYSNIGCHDVLRFVKSQFRGVNYWFKADILGCFYNMDQDVLCDKLRVFISDQSFIELY